MNYTDKHNMAAQACKQQQLAEGRADATERLQWQPTRTFVRVGR